MKQITIPPVWTIQNDAGEAPFNASLLHRERGKGSTLSALGEKRVGAKHQVPARLRQVMAQAPNRLRIHASHGDAVQARVEQLGVAGLYVPTGPF